MSNRENTIEVTELSDLLRFIELKINRSGIANPDERKEVISEIQHAVKMGFDLGKNGTMQFEIGE